MNEMNSFQDAFYIMAKELGFDYAQPLSPREVFETQMLPRIKELVATRPAAGEPVYQWKADGGWIESSERGIRIAKENGHQTRILYTAAPGAAHGDEAVQFESPEALAKAINEHCGYAEVNSALVATRIFAAMRAQAGEGGEV